MTRHTLATCSLLLATWDETRFIDGAPGSHTVIARRKGTAWLVGAISGEARLAAFVRRESRGGGWT